MKLFDRLIFAEIIAIFLSSVAVLIGFVWVAFGPLEAALRYIGMGIPVWRILEVAAFNIVPIFGYALPISMLLAVIVTFVRVSENSEAVALYAGGVSFYRMLVPVAMAAVCVTVAGLTLNNTIVPYAQMEITYFKTHISQEIQPVDQAISLPPVRDKDGNLVATIWVEGGYDTRTDSLRQVTVNEYDPKTGKPIATVYADRAKWEGGNDWTLQNATTLGAGQTMQSAALASQDIKISPQQLADLNIDPETLNFFQLARLIARLRAEHAGEVLSDETSLWEKVALPLASFIFALVGAPLGLRLERGSVRATALIYGVLAIFAYYVLRQILEIMANNGLLDPFVAAFLPDLLGMAAAAYLISRAPT